MGLTATGSAFNFCGLDEEVRRDRAPRFSVLQVPYDLTTSYVSGTRNGPRAIIEASAHMELYDEELGFEPYKAGIETLPPLEPTALGPEHMIDRVRDAAVEVLDNGRVPVLLGGEHSVTLGLVRALRERHPTLSVFHLDAHADMRDRYQDTPFNHACVARRISEICPIVQAGVRSLSREEALFLKDCTAVRTYYAADIRKGVDWGAVADGLSDEVFITIDLDVFDPSIMPATGTPEPGGLGWYEVLDALGTVISKKNVVGFDLVELSPIPGNVAPDFLAAKLAYKVMGYMERSLRREDRSSL